jgi:hypothetical protein
MDDIFWLDNVSAAESSTTDLTSIFAPIATQILALSRIS